jgi:hypothetical protein
MRTLELKNGRTEVALRPTGYQFPQAVQRGDANWLVVALTLRHSEKQFEHTDPALETFELEKMLRWITQIQDFYAAFASWAGPRLTSRLFFTEPNLSFEVFSASSLPMFRVYLAAETLPPFVRELGCSPDAAPDVSASEAWMDFPMPKEMLAEMAVTLSEWLRIFPPR